MTEYLIIEEKSSEIGSKLFSAMLLLLRKKIVGPIYSDVLEVFFVIKIYGGCRRTSRKDILLKMKNIFYEFSNHRPKNSAKKCFKNK